MDFSGSLSNSSHENVSESATNATIALPSTSENDMNLTAGPSVMDDDDDSVTLVGDADMSLANISELDSTLEDMFLFQDITDDDFFIESLVRRIESLSKCYREMTAKTLDALQKRESHERPWTSDTCTICIEEIPDKSREMLLECGHRFHLDCILIWFREQTTCPLCRKYISLLPL